jgi:hypothetical protein
MNTAFTREELEIMQRRVDDPDWDISQQNEVYEMLPRLLEMAKNSMNTVCAYCGHESPRDDASAIFDHIFSCDKRPEKTLLAKAFEVEDGLFRFLEHLTQDGYTPEVCNVCEEIQDRLSRWKSI